ncbi:hypothetical protein MX410_002787 [Escherichia coli]|nr:hypothetical protein [Escherichia coli]
MDHAIYTAMGAASQTLNQQAVTASNLANASTPGFRAQLNALRAVPVEGLSLPTRTLVTASTPGDPANTVAPVGRLKLVKATGSEVQRGDDGIFRLSAETQATRGPVLQADPTLRVMSGVLEGSNVNAVAAMSDMIASARRFEMQMKVISSVDDNAGRANQLLSMS